MTLKCPGCGMSHGVRRLLAAVVLLTLLAFLVAGTVECLLGTTGINVVGGILGILLAAVSADMILAGLKESGIFTFG